MKEGMILDGGKPLETPSIPHSKTAKNPMEVAMAPFESLSLSSTTRPSPLPSIENPPTKGINGGATVAPLQQHGGQHLLKRSAQSGGMNGINGIGGGGTPQRGKSKRAKVGVFEDAHEEEEKRDEVAEMDHVDHEAKNKRQRRASNEKSTRSSPFTSLSSTSPSSATLSSAAMMSPALPASASSASSVSSSAPNESLLDPSSSSSSSTSSQPLARLPTRKLRQSPQVQASNLAPSTPLLGGETEEMAAVSSLVQLSSSSIAPQMVMTNRSFAESNPSFLRSRMTLTVSKDSLSRQFRGTPVFAYNFKEFGC